MISDVSLMFRHSEVLFPNFTFVKVIYKEQTNQHQLYLWQYHSM